MDRRRRPARTPRLSAASIVPVLIVLLAHADAARPQEPSHAAMQYAAAYSDDLGGAAVLVMHRGEIIFEHYAEGIEPDQPIEINSGTKGFWGAVTAAMIDDGLIRSFDEGASETLTEWIGDPLKSRIKLRHLMQLNGLHVQDVDNLQGCHEGLEFDLYAHAISLPAARLPGEVFTYGPVNYYAFGEIIKRKLEPLGLSPLEYLEQRLFGPLGIQRGDWCFDDSGNPHLPNGAHMTARNWALWGRFLLQDGEWDGAQLVSAELMRELREPSEPNPAHGLFTWLNTPGGASYIGEQVNVGSDPNWPGGFIYNDGEPDVFGAMGGGKNRLYVVPSRELVIVRQTLASNDAFVDHAFLKILLGERRSGDYDFSQVTEFLDANLDAFENEVVVLVERNGERLYLYEEGITSATQRGIASATKWMAGAIVLAAHERGYYGLDDRVGDHLSVMEDAGKGDFTIRQAFGMTSGLYTERLDQRYHSSPDYTLIESVDLIAANVPMYFAPGSAIAYYGGQMQVVGLIAQQEVGVDWRELARTMLFDPLGMTETDYGQFGANPAVAGGIRSSARDYMKFLRMLDGGGMHETTPVLSLASVRLLLSNENRYLPILRHPFPDDSDWYPYGNADWPYAFGSWVLAADEVTTSGFEHTSPGAYGTWPWMDQRRDVQAVIFTEIPAGSQISTEATLQTMQLIRNAIDDVDERAVRLGIWAEPLYDPEALSEQDLMAFQDSGNKIWLTHLNPRDGFFAASTHGRDVLLDTGATALLESNNGPEFAVDVEGWSVFYSKPTTVSRIWRAEYDGETTTTTPLTPDDVARSNCLPSRFADSPGVLFGYMQGTAELGGTLYRADELGPFVEQAIMDWQRSDGVPVQWLPDRRGLAITQAPDGETVARLGILNADTGEIAYISDGSAGMRDPVPFNAPEYGGALCIAAVEQRRTLVVWREEGDGSWTEISRLGVPAESAYSDIASPEGLTFRGRSFISLQIETPDGQPAKGGEIWLWGIEDGPDRIALRCDDGSPELLRRTDPEFYVGDDDVFLIYNLIRDGSFYEFWRARSGVGKLLDQRANAAGREWGLY